jgi:hypothetical protein
MARPIDVSDVRANAPEIIVHAANFLRRAPQRRAVFEAIYRGKRNKKISELISSIPSLGRIRILQEGDKLDAHGIVVKGKDPKTHETTYSKINFYSKNYRKILNLAKNPQKIKKIPTKRNLTINNKKIEFNLPKRVDLEEIFIDGIESFKNVRKIKVGSINPQKISEKAMKSGFKCIIGESGSFKDWGGEKSDLYTTKIKIKSKRVSAAIAFKGKGTHGNLTPEKMGKRGTQIIRLFEEPARLFLIVYGGQIDSSISSQMRACALYRAITGQKIYYGMIDGDDLARLIEAYRKCFKL